MLKKSVVVALAILLHTAALAEAACTPEEAQAKHQEFMNAAILLAQKDTQRYQAVAQAMQTQLPELQKANDFEKLCAFYDQWIAKMK